MEQLANLQQRKSTSRAFGQSTATDPEPEFLDEQEQERVINSLQNSNKFANDAFRLVLAVFSVVELCIHLIFSISSGAVAWWHSKTDSLPSPSQNASPLAAGLCSFASFAIGILMIRDTTMLQRKEYVAGWTFVSIMPVVLMTGATEYGFEMVWWAMPLGLQVVDIVCLWIMSDPDADLVMLEKSRYKFKGA